MRVPKDEVDVKMQVPGAVLRQRMDFGDASGYGKISGEYFSLAAGVNTAPLFQVWKETSAIAPTGASCCKAR